jgi:L-iditol 2-dehydrogenase
MKVAAITGPRQAELIDQPDLEPVGQFVVVKIHAAPMCTEYKAYKSGHVTRSVGHEAAGEVVAVDHPGLVEIGDRVVVQPQYACGQCALCRAGEHIHCPRPANVSELTGGEHGRATYAQYVLKPDWLLTPIPEGMSYEHASMACCGLGPTFGAMQRMDLGEGETVLIAGLGPVGLGGVINARSRGARVLATEGIGYRADLARALGAEAVIDPDSPAALEQVMDLTDGVGVDKAVDCTAVPAAQRFVLDATRRCGQVAYVGWGGRVELDVVADVIQKGLKIHGAWHYNLHDAPTLMQLIAASGEPLDRLITHTFPLARVRDAWELQLTGECGKVVLHPWA